jgi:hypothetical protein
MHNVGCAGFTQLVTVGISSKLKRQADQVCIRVWVMLFHNTKQVVERLVMNTRDFGGFHAGTLLL